MKILLSDPAQLDLKAGYVFYESKQPGLGRYFLQSLTSDIDSLMISGGSHHRVHGYCRVLSKRFPFAIYYRLEEGAIRVRRILDCRRSPAWIRREIGSA